MVICVIFYIKTLFINDVNNAYVQNLDLVSVSYSKALTQSQSRIQSMQSQFQF